MLKVRLNLRKVVVIAICLAGSATMFAQEETGVLINGVMWATRNVGMPDTFVDNPEDIGVFYQWNRKIAWAATGDVTDWDSSTPNGTEWEKSNDPSPDGWRVPSKADRDKLLDSSKVDKVWSNTKKGYTFTDKTSGNSIFLPAKGYRNSEGTLNTNNIGYYWSRTEMVGSDAYCFWLDIGLAAPTAINKRSGFSIRCVADENNTSVSEVSTTGTATIVGYFDLFGRTLKEEPTTGIYIIQYDNGTTKKMMK